MKENVLKSIYAGIVIGLAGYIFLALENKTMGAFLFSIGLFSVFVLQLNLYTGKVCLRSCYEKPLQLLLVFVGNAIGTLLVSFLTIQSVIHENAVTLALVKFDKPILRLFLDGIVCGICIALAVYGYRKAEGAGKYLAVVLAVMGFILCGAEHVVADMFYLFAAHTGDVFSNFKVICFSGLGNTIGGLLFTLFEGNL